MQNKKKSGGQFFLSFDLVNSFTQNEKALKIYEKYFYMQKYVLKQNFEKKIGYNIFISHNMGFC